MPSAGPDHRSASRTSKTKSRASTKAHRAKLKEFRAEVTIWKRGSRASRRSSRKRRTPPICCAGSNPRHAIEPDDPRLPPPGHQHPGDPRRVADHAGARRHVSQPRDLPRSHREVHANHQRHRGSTSAARRPRRRRTSRVTAQCIATTFVLLDKPAPPKPGASQEGPRSRGRREPNESRSRHRAPADAGAVAGANAGHTRGRPQRRRRPPRPRRRPPDPILQPGSSRRDPFVSLIDAGPRSGPAGEARPWDRRRHGRRSRGPRHPAEPRHSDRDGAGPNNRTLHVASGRPAGRWQRAR